MPGVLLVEPTRLGDVRGFFSETYRRTALAEAGFDAEFVQENQSVSELIGTVRGLHFQRPPYAQDKLVRVISGRILDVAVDVRSGSPTFGKSVVAELSADNFRQLLVPAGFAHGFQTLTPGAVVLYRVTEYYRAEAEGGLLWSDPDLQIDWPIPPTRATINGRDAALPKLGAFRSPFTYEAPAKGRGFAPHGRKFE